MRCCIDVAVAWMFLCNQEQYSTHGFWQCKAVHYARLRTSCLRLFRHSAKLNSGNGGDPKVDVPVLHKTLLVDHALPNDSCLGTELFFESSLFRN